MTDSFQTIVVGSGPAGIAAAACAAEAGHRVGIVDDNPNPGGQIWRSLRGQSAPDTSHGGGAAQWYSRLVATSATRLQSWSVFDQPEPGILRAERQGETAHLHYDNLIIATGARERFLPFPGWTLPNVMGVGAIQAMVKGGLPVAGKRIVLAGSGPLLLAVAATLAAARAIIICICEQASLRQLAPFALGLAADPAKIMQGLRYKVATLDVPFHTSTWPVEADGDGVLRSVTISHHGEKQQIPCDYLACGFSSPTRNLPPCWDAAWKQAPYPWTNSSAPQYQISSALESRQESEASNFRSSRDRSPDLPAPVKIKRPVGYSIRSVKPLASPTVSPRPLHCVLNFENCRRRQPLSAAAKTSPMAH